MNESAAEAQCCLRRGVFCACEPAPSADDGSSLPSGGQKASRWAIILGRLATAVAGRQNPIGQTNLILEASVNRPVIVVHGGAWYIAEQQVDAFVDGCRRAASAGWSILRAGGSAVDAVEAAVRILEDDPAYDAGRGSLLTRMGACNWIRF